MTDELLSSWLCRSAHAHCIAPYAFLSLRLPETPVWDRDIDRSATAGLLADVDRAAALRPGTAANASLAPWIGVLAPAFEAPGVAHVPLLLAVGLHHRTRRLHGLQYCPECLAGSEPRFARWGRLAFAPACPTHGTPALDGCPWCDAPVVPHRAPAGRLADCHACGLGLARRRDRGTPAGFDEAVRLQRLCLAALDAGDGGHADLPCPGRDFLSMARSLASALVGTPSGRPEAGADAVEPGGRRQLERMRIAGRIPVLANLGAWLDDWPAGFADRAAMAGLTRRSFLRLALPPVLAKEVMRLEEGVRRPRAAWRSVLDDAGMRSLHRVDPSAFRNARARRILAASGSGPRTPYALLEA